MLARKAPTAIAGHIGRPQMSTAASAMPVGGQMAVTLWFANAECEARLGRAEIERAQDRQTDRVPGPGCDAPRPAGHMRQAGQCASPGREV